jgi:hypothetical protein
MWLEVCGCADVYYRRHFLPRPRRIVLSSASCRCTDGRLVCFVGCRSYPVLFLFFTRCSRAVCCQHEIHNATCMEDDQGKCGRKETWQECVN